MRHTFATAKRPAWLECGGGRGNPKFRDNLASGSANSPYIGFAFQCSPDPKLGNPRLVPATPAMAAVARATRSRQVAERTADVLAVLRQVQDEGAGSLRTIAAGLQAHGVLTPAGKAYWSATQVWRVLFRAEIASTSRVTGG